MTKELFTIENTRAIFKNFEGREGKFNAAGKRSFAITLDEKQAKELKKAGFNVKDPKNDGDDWFLSIAVAKNFYNNPTLNTVSDGVAHEVDFENAKELDFIEFDSVDVTFKKYEWTVNGNSGIKAYLDEFYGVLPKKALAGKYTKAGANDNVDFEINEDELPF